MLYLRKGNKALIALSLLAALVLSSCTGDSSGNSSGTLSGLSLSPLVVADHVSVVEPQSGGGSPSAPSGIKALLIGLISPSQLPATSDYFADKTTVYVNERSTESFRTINEILCMVRQTRYDAMVNRGPYLALVDQNLCSSNRSDASNGGTQTTNQSSGATAPSYMSWVTDSYRGSSTSPQIVRYWITSSSEVDILILARMTITESAETAPPYGLFKMDFQMVDPVTMAEFFRGVLVAEKDPTGKASLKFASVDTNLYEMEFATLAKDPNGTSGAGTVLKAHSGPGATPTAERFNIAYDATLFRRHDTQNTTPDDPVTGDICLDRTDFNESAWSYGLYTEPDGSRFNLNSGFSIKVGSDFGWIGYWGVWLPAGMTLANGETVYRHDFQTNTDTPYTVFQAGGKLKKHTKKQLTLGQIRNVPLYWWDYNTSAYYTIIWDSISGKFTKTAWQDPSGQWKNCTDVTAPCGTGSWDLNLSTLNSSDINVWSQALSGSVRVPLGSAVPGTSTCMYSAASGYTDCSGFNNNLSLFQRNNTPVIFYTENIVYPGDVVPATLACFDNCPQPSDTNGIDPAANPLPFYPNWDPTNGKSLEHDYSFSPSTMLLMDGPNPVILSSTSADPYHQWGVTTGALIEPTAQNLALLDCNWDGDNNPITNPQICGWKAGSELSEFYNWETGPDSWNQLTVLQDSTGAFVRFDPPLQVQYTHAQTDPTAPDYKYNGVTFYLEYNGFGSLSGIPGICVDMNTGLPASCGPDTWWVPEFLIPDTKPDGSGDLTEVFINGDPAKPLIVKALQKEQRMKNPGIAACITAGLTTTAYPLPDMSEWDAPAIGHVPTITSAPKVIGGVVQ